MHFWTIFHSVFHCLCDSTFSHCYIYMMSLNPTFLVLFVVRIPLEVLWLDGVVLCNEADAKRQHKLEL